MDNRTEMREFLATRRAKIAPDQAGVPLYGQRRQVPGLRPEEVAQLAGLPTDYYTRREKGNLRGASDSVLEAIARALQLNEAERAHLVDLARAARHRPRASPPDPAPAGRPSLQHLRDAMTAAVAFVRNGPARRPGGQTARPRLLRTAARGPLELGDGAEGDRAANGPRGDRQYSTR